ncbi:MAG: polyhydroxyalkanoate synthesis regulator DNA-binding domain-containing protein [Bradymonadaceae bacterium]
MSRLIKRYPNRKLYDTETSSYITLETIEEMVREGEDVCIIDNVSKDDITHSILAHIVLDSEKASESAVPLAVLQGVIQSGEGFWNKVQSPVLQFREEFRRRGEVLESGGKAIRDFVDGTQRSIDEMQSRIDERLRDAVDQITHIPTMRLEMDALEERVRRLESLLSEKEAGRGEDREEDD